MGLLCPFQKKLHHKECFGDISEVLQQMGESWDVGELGPENTLASFSVAQSISHTSNLPIWAI